MDPTMIFTLPDPDTDHAGFATGTLGSRVADKLLQKIRADRLAPGTRLPSEQAMAQHFGVSRTVVREAIALLKAEGILSTRKGSGAFICKAEGTQLAKEDALTEQSVQSLLNLIEVRRGLESETAALAAGVSGVEEDVRFHLSIAEATGNPYWAKFVEMFAQPTRSAIKVTRANEARRVDFSSQVRQEHEKIVSAIAAGDPELARIAAAEHMTNAAERVRLADREFWRGDGGELARSLVRDRIMNK